MTPRRILFWLHLLTGVVVGVVVAFLAVTGCILSFRAQMIRIAEHAFVVSKPSASHLCLAPSHVLMNSARLGYGEPTSWTLYADQRPAELIFPHGRVLLVDACNGMVLDTNAGRLRSFFDQVHDLHRYVALVGTKHENLRAFKNACVLGFLFLLLSGVILWIPRQWTSKHVRASLVPRWRGIGRSSEWSLHTVFGFWLFLPLAVMLLTGIVMAYSWGSSLLYLASGEVMPPTRPEHEISADVLPVARYQELDRLIAKAQSQDPAWHSVMLRIPTAKGKEVSFTLDEGDGLDPRTKSQLSLARKSGEVMKWLRYTDNSRARRWRVLAHFIHTGELFGLLGQSIAFSVSLGALLLAITGFSLTVRRYLGWRGRRIRMTTIN